MSSTLEPVFWPLRSRILRLVLRQVSSFARGAFIPLEADLTLVNLATLVNMVPMARTAMIALRALLTQLRWVQLLANLAPETLMNGTAIIASLVVWDWFHLQDLLTARIAARRYRASLQFDQLSPRSDPLQPLPH